MNFSELLAAAQENKITSEDFLATLWKLSKDHQRQARVYSPEAITIYRTRVFNENIRPNRIENLSYPPTEYCKLQRANDVGEQMFYASAGLPTTLAESRVITGQYIIVSKWRNNKEIVLQEVGLNAELQGIEQLYHDIFTARDEGMYKYSSKVANHLMASEFIDGLLYPSIINQNQSHNLVLKKDTVDEGLVFINASLYIVKSVSSDTKYEVEELDFATPTNDDLLDWKGRRKQWIIREAGGKLKMRSNGWDWEAYTPEGVYVEPE
jgi:RES domain